MSSAPMPLRLSEFSTARETAWYAINVRSRSEWMVAEGLRAKGYDPFLPTYKSRRHWSDRIKVSELPLFSGYLFCQFDIQQRLPILKTPGVKSIVGSGRNPESIQRTEIEAIQNLVKSGLSYKPYPYVTVGQLVRVEQGSLCGLVGLIKVVKHETRLIISVSLLMRSVLVEINRSWVEPLRSSAVFDTSIQRRQHPEKAVPYGITERDHARWLSR